MEQQSLTEPSVNVKFQILARLRRPTKKRPVSGEPWQSQLLYCFSSSQSSLQPCRGIRQTSQGEELCNGWDKDFKPSWAIALITQIHSKLCNRIRANMVDCRVLRLGEWSLKRSLFSIWLSPLIIGIVTIYHWSCHHLSLSSSRFTPGSHLRALIGHLIFNQRGI